MKQIAFLGLGAMGSRMAARLLETGHDLVVWNRTPEAAARLSARGAARAATPAEAARAASIILLMLEDAAAVVSVVEGTAGVAEGLSPGKLLCDMSSVDPVTSGRLAAACTARRARFVDAPVSGSLEPAEKGELVILAGGQARDVQELQPIFSSLGRLTLHAGPTGAGATLKLAINQAGAHVLAGLASGLAMARQAGIDGGLYLEALAAGPFGSPAVKRQGAAMLADHFEPSFRLRHMLKDLRLASETAHRLGLMLPSLEALVRLHEQAVAKGLGELDFAALYKLLEGAVPAPKRS